MVLFSDLRRFELVDGRGQRARLLDMAVDLSAGDYPPVRLLIITGPNGSPAALIAGGGLVALIPNLPVIQLLIGVQVLNGVLLPVVLVFLLRLVNDRHLTGGLKITTRDNVLGWTTFAIVTAAVATLLGVQLLGLVGITVG